MPKTSGTIANHNGTNLEVFIENLLAKHGYTHVHGNKFEPATYLQQPIYAKQFKVGTSIYDSEMFCDFIIYHPDKYPLCLVIESKWQEAKGSVDEKYPYLVINIKTKTPYKTILLLDGSGYRPQAEKWLRDQVDDKLLHVFSMAQFQKWTNKGMI